MRLSSLLLAALAACAGSPDRQPSSPVAAPPPAAEEERTVAPAEPEPPPAPEEQAPSEPEAPPAEPPPIAWGSEVPEAQGGRWVPPELRAIVDKVEGTRARPTRVTWLGGSAASGCQEVWRFRLLYGAYERFANVSAFSSRDAARSCAEAFRKEHGRTPEAWAAIEPLQQRVGPYFVVFTSSLQGEPELRAELLRVLEEQRFEKATAVPRGEIPVGAVPELFQRRTRAPPPPKKR